MINADPLQFLLLVEILSVQRDAYVVTKLSRFAKQSVVKLFLIRPSHSYHLSLQWMSTAHESTQA